MKQEKQNRIEEILNAWDGAKRAEAPAFFYTRLKARMLARQTGGEKDSETRTVKSWYLKPVFVIAALIAVVIINAFIFFQDTNTAAVQGNEETIQTIAAEYNLSDNILEEINQ